MNNDENWQQVYVRYHYSHITDEEIEAQRDKWLAQGNNMHRDNWQS